MDEKLEGNKFLLVSPGFKNGHDIPEQYTAHGKNVSPPLEWYDAPSDAQEFALIMEDPDAPKNPPYIHWVAYHISPDQTELKENVASNGGAVVMGTNSDGMAVYTGPNPPEKTGVHRYYFRLFALDAKLDVQPGATADQLMEAMRGHVIGEAEIVGRHQYH